MLKEFPENLIFSPRDKNIDRVRCLQLGVGATNGQDQTGRLWSAVESAHRINYLELLAVFLALKSFEKDLSHCTVLVKSDNILAVTYINQKGVLTVNSYAIWQ